MGTIDDATRSMVEHSRTNPIELPSYEETIFHSQAEDIARMVNAKTEDAVHRLNATTEAKMDELKTAVDQAGRDSLFSKVVAIISIVIALIAAIFAGVSLALQLGLQM